MTVWTIWHSNHRIDYFTWLLQKHKIQVLVDIRKTPYSSHNPQFNKEELKSEVEKLWIIYTRHYWLWWGDYTEVDYKEHFEKDIDWLIKTSEKYKTAIMCSEWDPRKTKWRNYECHRLSRITPELVKRWVEVKHILPEWDVIDNPTKIIQWGLF